MKRMIIGMLALTTLAACSSAPECAMKPGDDVYRKRTRDYNWYDGRTPHHGATGQRDALYHNGAKDGQWTTAD